MTDRNEGCTYYSLYKTIASINMRLGEPRRACDIIMLRHEDNHFISYFRQQSFISLIVFSTKARLRIIPTKIDDIISFFGLMQE